MNSHFSCTVPPKSPNQTWDPTTISPQPSRTVSENIYPNSPTPSTPVQDTPALWGPKTAVRSHRRPHPMMGDDDVPWSSWRFATTFPLVSSKNLAFCLLLLLLLVWCWGAPCLHFNGPGMCHHHHHHHQLEYLRLLRNAINAK